MKEIRSIISSAIDLHYLILENDTLLSQIKIVSEVLTQCFETGNKVLLCGNGGSSADAQHLAAEFSGRFYLDRKALPAEALHCNSSYLTAVANDYSYDLIYSRLLEGIGKHGDVLIGITTSGNSKNIINAFTKAKEIGIKTIALTGETGGELKNHANLLINIPSTDTPRIQESHILIGHIICYLVEKNLFETIDNQ
jgi:D-sedoheptulose 7-phosphate isomerase